MIDAKALLDFLALLDNIEKLPAATPAEKAARAWAIQQVRGYVRAKVDEKVAA